MKPLVLLRAPFLTLSGYGTHARQIGEWLMRLVKNDSIELYCEPLYWGTTTWITNIDRDPLVNALATRCKKLPRKPDVSFQLQLPNEWDPNLATINVGITAAVETDKAVPEWAACCDAMSHVVVPSQHSLNSLKAAGWSAPAGKAHVIGESFPDAMLGAPSTAALDPLPLFTFLVFGQMTGQDNARVDRKNLHNTVKWLLEEFTDDKEVGILLKTNQGRSTVFDAYHTENIVRSIVKEVASRTKKTLPELHLVHGDLNDIEVAALYRHPNVKALVSATRGEGFGLPLLEAAACDLPVIATGWSAHTEFLGLGRYVDLPCTLQPIPKERADGKIFPVGAKWAEVSEGDFKRRIRKFRTSASIPRDWARELGVKIRTKYSQDAIAAAWSAAFDDMLQKVSG